MSAKWISHYSESGSPSTGPAKSTGQAINVQHIYKVRTFVRVIEKRNVFSIAFDRNSDTKESSTTWTFSTLEDALVSLAKIVQAMEGVAETGSYESLISNKIFVDLSNGFGIKKAD